MTMPAVPPQPQKCNNCGGKIFQKIDGLYALTKVEKQPDGGVSFLPASGIPVMVLICRNCGEMKLYPAKLFGLI